MQVCFSIHLKVEKATIAQMEQNSFGILYIRTPQQLSTLTKSEWLKYRLPLVVGGRGSDQLCCINIK